MILGIFITICIIGIFLAISEVTSPFRDIQVLALGLSLITIGAIGTGIDICLELI